MNINLDNKVAIVTGGTRGIGLGCAKQLAESGAKVAVIGQSAKNVAIGTTAVQKKGTARGYQLDVANVGAIASVIERIRKEMGEIDILVCSAGIDLGEPRPIITITQEEWDRLYAVNVRGMFFSMQAVAIQSMIPRKTGAIVNIASQVGLVGCPMCIPYCTSKAAVVQITRAAAIEWAAYNIRVNAVAPAWTETDMANTFFTNVPELKPHEIAKMPLGRLAEVDEIAPAACFLASDLASMITGVALPIDGGWTAQ